MPFDQQAFRASMNRDGVRPNLFECRIAFPDFAAVGLGRTNSDGLSLVEQFTFRCRASQLPGSTVNSVPVNYFGREIKLPGNRTFPEWTVTIIEDEDFKIRNAFELWMNGLNTHRGNLRLPAAVSSAGYSRNATVIQYGKAGNPLKSYTFIGAFPIDISPIDVDWSQNDTVAEYAVTLAYQWWEEQPGDSVGGTPPERNVSIF